MGHKPRTLNTQLTTENWIQTTLVPELFVIINALANVETKYIQYTYIHFRVVQQHKDDI